MTKFIVIASGKGGTGKTTIAVNLAAALHNFGRDVILVDANLTTPNIGMHLGSPVTPTSFHDVLKEKKKVHESAYKHSTGLRVIPSSIGLEHLDEVNSHKIDKAFDNLKGTAEVVVVDSVAGLAKQTKDVIKAADYVIVVTTPDLPSVTDALKTIKLAEKQHKQILGVIINRVENDKLELEIQNIESMLGKRVIAVIPEHKTVKKALYLKQPIVHSYPDSPVSLEIKKLATELVGVSEEQENALKQEESAIKKLLKKIKKNK